MPQRYDAVIIGGGHNGLISAAYLARAGPQDAGPRAAPRPRRRGGHRGDRPGLPVLGRELRRQPAAAGGHPRPRAAQVRPRHPAARRHVHAAAQGPAKARAEGGDYLWRVNDHGRTVRELRRWSKSDAEAYEEYGQLMVEMARFIKPILGIVPADPTDNDPRPLLPLAGLARRFGQLPERQQAVFVQLMTMSAADFLDQWFETDPLKATMSASGIIGTYQGIRSPGTAYVLLHHYMGEIDGAFRAWGIPKGGTGGVSYAIARAAQALGAEIRTEAPVARIMVQQRPGDRRRPRERRGDRGVQRPLVRRREGHVPRPAGGRHARPRVRAGGPPVQVPRQLGQGQPRRRRAAGLHVPARRRRAPAGRDLASARRWRRWSRPTTTRSTATGAERPYIDMIIPTLVDPQMAPPGKHVISCFVQYAPYKLDPSLGTWDDQPRGVRRRGHRPDRGVRAQHPGHHRRPPGPDAARHRADDRPDRGQHLPGRAVARAAVLQPAGPGLRAVPDADPRPVAVGLVDASGRRPDGRQRPARRARGPQVPRPEGGLTWRRRPTGYDAIVIGAGHNGLVAAAYLATGGLRVARPRGPRPDRRRDRDRGAGARRPGPVARPHGRAAAAVGRPRARAGEARPVARRARGARVRAPARRPGGLAVERPRPRRSTRSAAGPPTTPPRTSSSTGACGPSRGSSPTSATRRRPRSRRRASATRSWACGSGARSAAWARTTDARSCACSRWRSPTSSPSRSRRRADPGDARLARRPLHGDGPVVGGHDRGAARRRGRQRRRGGGRDGLRAVAVRRRSPTRSPRRRGRPGAEIRTSARVASDPRGRRRGHGRRARGRRGDRGPGDRLGHRPEAPADRPRRPGDARAVDALAGRQHPDARDGGQGQPRPRRPARVPGRGRRRRGCCAAGSRSGTTSIDDVERAFDASKYGRISDSPVLEATIPSLVDPSLVAGAAGGTQVMSVLDAVDAAEARRPTTGRPGATRSATSRSARSRPWRPGWAPA